MADLTDCSTKLRCPKCRSNDLQLVEHGWWTSAWSVTNGRAVRKEGYHEPGGIEFVRAECLACRHDWRVRKAIQITDVLVMDDPEA
jgi:hypothetical protein